IRRVDTVTTSHCEWSPDGKFILIATLSPRLRVDNGIKLWYLLGQLLHVQDCEELYQASWRPTPVDTALPFPAVIPPAPAPSTSVHAATATAKPSPARPFGAYRPPSARGLLASLRLMSLERSCHPSLNAYDLFFFSFYSFNGPFPGAVIPPPFHANHLPSTGYARTTAAS
ncbi:eukaryotic translation initiation factor eIF2A-domain-containing protein, partial [Lactarius pseudohatsudake]